MNPYTREELDEFIYQEIRRWGAKGRRVRARALINSGVYSSYLVRLTEKHPDIAEEDDGSIFSTRDWDLIKTRDWLMERTGLTNRAVGYGELGTHTLQRMMEAAGEGLVS